VSSAPTDFETDEPTVPQTPEPEPDVTGPDEFPEPNEDGSEVDPEFDDEV
jgi:hypothetical protein